MVQPTMARVSLGIKVSWPADMEWMDDDERDYCTSPFTARDALSILQNIPDSDLVTLGFSPSESHPMNMIMQNMVVPPPSTRPAIYSSEGSRSRGQNDLTMRLLEILKRSHDLQNGMNEDTWKTLKVVTVDLMDRINRLQYEVFMMVNNNSRIAKPAGMGRNSSNVNGKASTNDSKAKRDAFAGTSWEREWTFRRAASSLRMRGLNAIAWEFRIKLR
jgi:DNA-directed RNA polymerase beta' subunit